MFFLQLIEHIGVGILAAFLAFSGMLADQIETGLGALGMTPTPPSTEESLESEEVTPTATHVQKLPSRYEYGGAIPRILIDHAGYQQAAALTGTQEATTGTGPSTQEAIKDALVNIFCTYREDEHYTRATTGSGVFIDSRGIILTNAHVAQFLLLEDNARDVRCVIRTGSPATPKYIAELLYISPAWIYENAALIDAANPSGTGERDYALLYVSETLEGALPARFPALPVATEPLNNTMLGAPVLVGGYPAEILHTDGPRAKLEPVVGSTTITELYTFGVRTADLVAIGPSVAGEQGSSGGPILSPDGSVMGLIVTRGRDEIDGKGSLRGLTLSYIDATIKEETGFDLKSTLAGDLPKRARVFKDALIPFLSSVLSRELE